MNNTKVALVGGTGMSANGKTTFLDLLVILLNISDSGGRIIRAEMSKVIGRARKLHGPLGDAVRKNIPLMDVGGFLPDNVAIPVFESWLATATMQYPQIETMFIGGFPRTEQQKQKVDKLFHSKVIIEIKIDPEQSFQSTLERLKKSGANARKDDQGGIPVFQNRLAAFKSQTVPMLDSCNGELIRLSRDQQIEERLEQTLVHIREMHESTAVIPKKIATKALNRLYSRNHRVHEEIVRVTTGQGITPGLVTYL